MLRTLLMKDFNKELDSYNFVNLDGRIEFELNGVIEKEANCAYNIDNLMACFSCIDYTTLNVSDTENKVNEFVIDLLKKLDSNSLPKISSVCTYPAFIPIVERVLNGSGILVSSVSGYFPSGHGIKTMKIEECKAAIDLGAVEIDVVIGVGDILEGNYEKAYNDMLEIRQATKGITLKVILETGELKNSENIFKASLIAMYAGADFVKTSTGKVPIVATSEAVCVMAEAIKQYKEKCGRNVGLKVSGGISKSSTAVRYRTIVKHFLGEEWITPSLFRIGSSSLLNDMIREIKALKAKKEEED